jgi:hypothetical protein
MADTVVADGVGVANVAFRSDFPAAFVVGSGAADFEAEDFGAEEVAVADGVTLVVGVAVADGAATGGYGNRAYTSILCRSRHGTTRILSTVELARLPGSTHSPGCRPPTHSSSL